MEIPLIYSQREQDGGRSQANVIQTYENMTVHSYSACTSKL